MRNIKMSDQRLFWEKVQEEAKDKMFENIIMSKVFKLVLDNVTFRKALAEILALKTDNPFISVEELKLLFYNILEKDECIIKNAIYDCYAFVERDPSITSVVDPILFSKGYQSLQIYRISHFLWQNKQHTLARLIQSLCSEKFGVDIHPAAVLGKGLFIDHATSLVIGETAIIEDNVSMLHEVTLGGTGKETGKRHPTIKNNVLIGAGAKILGNVVVGKYSKIGASSVVLNDVEPYSTVVGIPGRTIYKKKNDNPAINMNWEIDDFEK